MSYVSLWSVGSRVRAALTVTLVAETENALQFEVADNTKMKLWFPRKAISVYGGEGQYKIAHWFSFNAFQRSAFDRYASHYKA
jgi:hypothetical protein